MNRSKKVVPMISLVVTMLFFGSIGLISRNIPLPSSIVAMTRGLVGAAFLWAVTRLAGLRMDKAAVRRRLPVLVGAGAAIGINWILLFEAYRYTTVATVALCYYLAPVVVILSAPFLFGERLTLRKVVCVVLTLTGVLLVSADVFSGFGGTGRDVRGILTGVCASIFYAAVMLLNKTLGDVPAFDRTIVELAISGLMLVPYTLVSGAWQTAASVTMTPRAWFFLAVMAILYTGVAYATYFYAVGTLPAQTVALYNCLDMVVAVFLSTVLLHEPMTALDWIGAVLILACAIISELPEKKKG